MSDEAIVGIYYIKDVKELKAALKHLMDNDIRTKGEFQLTDALQMMIEQGCKFQIWAARHNSAVALYVVEPFRRQGDAPPLTTRSLLRNMWEGNAAKVCAQRGHDRCRKNLLFPCSVFVLMFYIVVKMIWGIVDYVIS